MMALKWCKASLVDYRAHEREQSDMDDMERGWCHCCSPSYAQRKHDLCVFLFSSDEESERTKEK